MQCGWCTTKPRHALSSSSIPPAYVSSSPLWRALAVLRTYVILLLRIVLHESRAVELMRKFCSCSVSFLHCCYIVLLYSCTTIPCCNRAPSNYCSTAAHTVPLHSYTPGLLYCCTDVARYCSVELLYSFTVVTVRLYCMTAARIHTCTLAYHGMALPQYFPPKSGIRIGRSPISPRGPSLNASPKPVPP